MASVLFGLAIGERRRAHLERIGSERGNGRDAVPARDHQDALPSQVRMQTGCDDCERDPAWSRQAVNNRCWDCSVSTRLIDDVEPRGLGLQLVVVDLRKQNHGLGLHDVLLSFLPGSAALHR